MSDSELLSGQQAEAEYPALTANYLRRKALQGQIPSYVIRHKRLFKRVDLVEHIESRRRQAPAATDVPPFDVEEAARRLVKRTCAEQGLPETVEDPVVLAAVAQIIRKAAS